MTTKPIKTKNQSTVHMEKIIFFIKKYKTSRLAKGLKTTEYK